MTPPAALTDNERWYLALTALWARRPREALVSAEAQARARRDIAFARRVMALPPGARILDYACAWGRTTVELARQGYQVTGLDLSPDLLDLARAHARERGQHIAFIEATIRCIPLGRGFDAITGLYDDSLLSFEDEADNLTALKEVARLLRLGGRLLFGTTDCPLVLPAYQRSAWREAGEHIVEEIVFDARHRTGVSVRSHRHADGAAQAYHRVRHHYTPAEAAALLNAAGLRLIGAWCAYDEALHYGSRSEGMVLLAEKA